MLQNGIVGKRSVMSALKYGVFSIVLVISGVIVGLVIIHHERIHSLSLAGNPDQVLDQKPSKLIWEQLDKTNWISHPTNKASHVVYVFMDPNCLYCHRLWLAIHGKSSVQFRYVLVGLVNKTSFPRAVSILDKEDPVGALEFNEAHFQLRKGETSEGGIPLDARPSQSSIEKIVENNAIFQRLASNMLPTLFYMSDGHVHVIHGVPAQQTLEKIEFIGASGVGQLDFGRGNSGCKVSVCTP